MGIKFPEVPLFLIFFSLKSSRPKASCLSIWLAQDDVVLSSKFLLDLRDQKTSQAILMISLADSELLYLHPLELPSQKSSQRARLRPSDRSATSLLWNLLTSSISNEEHHEVYKTGCALCTFVPSRR